MNIRIGEEAFAWSIFNILPSQKPSTSTSYLKPEIRDTTIMDSVFQKIHWGQYFYQTKNGKPLTFTRDVYKDTIIKTKTDQVESTRQNMKLLNEKLRNDYLK